LRKHLFFNVFYVTQKGPQFKPQILLNFRDFLGGSIVSKRNLPEECGNDGVMEGWNSAKEQNSCSHCSQTIIPGFHYSNIPAGQSL
jgi:hypothetical protein